MTSHSMASRAGVATITSALLTAGERSAYAETIRQQEAIFALEGMHPTAQDKAIDAAVLAGRVSPEQALDELVAYAKEHKTVDGFYESRPWATR